MNGAPTSERLHIAFFGRRNAGKSSLVNLVAGQPVAIVSEVAGTTTDPVQKSMEILPLGPVVLIDTAGLDDEGELGDLRVERSRRVLDRADLVVLVVAAGLAPGLLEEELAGRAREKGLPVVVAVTKGDTGADPAAGLAFARSRALPALVVSAEEPADAERLRRALVDAAPRDAEPPLVGDLVAPGDLAVLVVPIDQAAPKGRLILPQVMTLRDLLDHDAVGVVVKERELAAALGRLPRPRLVITDSQAFLKVAADTPPGVPLTSFSILLARHRGDLALFAEGARALDRLRPGDRVLLAEGCTHHRQADDIGEVQIPRWIRQHVGGEVHFSYSSGLAFPDDLESYKLIVHCGACTLNRREILHRQREASRLGVPMTNYGVLLAAVHGILDRALELFPAARLAFGSEPEEPPPRPLKLARTV